MRASHTDLLSLQKRMVIEGWLALADVQIKVDSMAAASPLVRAGEHSTFGFDGDNHFRLDWGSSSNNCCRAPVSYPSTSGSISVNGTIDLV